MEKILLAVDGSEHSTRATALAGELSKRFGATVDVVHVISEHDLFAPGLQSYVSQYAEIEQFYDTRRASMESAGARVALAAARRVEDAGGTIGEENVAVGDVASEIVEKAKLLKSDCIVMGRRGLGGVAGLLLGSVTHKVGQMTDTTLITTP